MFVRHWSHWNFLSVLPPHWSSSPLNCVCVCVLSEVRRAVQLAPARLPTKEQRSPQRPGGPDLVSDTHLPPAGLRRFPPMWRDVNTNVTRDCRLTLRVCVQAKLMSECSSSIDSVKRVKLILNDDEELEDPGLTVSTADKQTSTGRDGTVTPVEVSRTIRALNRLHTTPDNANVMVPLSPPVCRQV